MKEELLKALDEIKENYDAYFFSNKYCDENLTNNTHKIQFELLRDNLEGEYKMGALNWILHNYDCYYKDDVPYGEDNAFTYLKNLIEEI